jgi:hypothetical protein
MSEEPQPPQKEETITVTYTVSEYAEVKRILEMYYKNRERSRARYQKLKDEGKIVTKSKKSNVVVAI